MVDERIHVLRNILLELHNGASPESIQERFDATFAGVSAIEISLMDARADELRLRCHL